MQTNDCRPKTCLKKHHDGTPLDHFCHDCREVICNKCATMMHKNHRVEECHKIRMEITDEMLKAEEKLAQDDAEIESVAQRVRAADSRLEAIEKMLHNFVDKFVDVIKRQEEEMTKEIQRLRLVSAFDAEDIEFSIRRHKSELETTVEYASVLLEQGDFQEMCDEAETVKGALRQLSSFEIISKPLVAERKTFAPNTAFFDHLFANGIGRIITVDPGKCSAIGKGVNSSSPLSLGIEATFSISTCTPTGDVIHAPYEGMSAIVMYKPETNCTFGTFTQDISKNIKDNRDGWYTASYIPTRTGTALVSIKVGGEHIDGSPFEVKIKPRKYKPVKTLGKKGKGLGYFLGPWCSAENSDGDIYVTDRDNDRIQVFDKDGSYVRKIGEFGSGDGQLVKPRGIAIDKNGNVIVVDNGNNRIQIFDKNGNFKSKFGGYGDKEGQLNNPYAVAIDDDDNYIISDADNKRVQIFTPGGEVVRVFGNEGKEQIKGSYYCIYHQGRYILSDFEDYSIKLFNKKGEFQEKIGKKGMLSGEFAKWLRGLAIDKVGNLLVCDSCADRIQVFEPHGSSFKFLEKFGRFGEKLGQFKQPTTVTVLRDGRLVVCEFHNSRVQILE